MDLEEVMKVLESKGNHSTKSIYIKHGAREPLFGVKVGDLKPIQKKIKKDYELSIELYNTDNSDAMYLAGLIAHEEKMKKSDLNKWAKNAYWYMISEYTVPWVTAESRYGYELGLKWIDSPKENIAAAGWSTLANIMALKEDDELPLDTYLELLKRIEKDIHNSANRVRYTMNGFVISLGTYVSSLLDAAEKVASNIGEVQVDMGGTACKVPFAPDYIKKVKKMGRVGKKKKTVRC